MKRNCLACGQFTDRNHRCAGGLKSKAPTPLRANIGSQNKIQEPTVLFASKGTLITLLPDGSLLKSKTNADGTETITGASLLTRILYANKVAKAKVNYSLNRAESMHNKNKSQVDKAWETYAEVEEAYAEKNELINDIASKVAQCKELIVQTDKESEKIMANALDGVTKIVEPYKEAVVKAFEEYKKVEKTYDTMAIANAYVQLELAKAKEKVAVDKGNALLDNATLQIYTVKETPRQALVALEEQLAKASEPDVKAD